MSRSRASNYLLLSAVIALLFAGTGAFILWGALKEKREEEAKFKQATNLVQELKERYLKTAEDEDSIRSAISEFNALEKQSLIVLNSDVASAQQRLEWAEQVRKIARDHALPKLDFELAPQRTLQSLGAEKNFSLVASQMKIKMGLLHEGDLLHVLDALQKVKGARVSNKSCSIYKATNDTSQSRATLLADCDMDWVFVQRDTFNQSRVEVAP